jgi:hypothetical protein
VTTMSGPLRQRSSIFFRSAELVNSSAEPYFWLYGSVFLLLFLACFVAQDLRLKMWNDEIITLYAARQGGPLEIAQAIKAGMDATPPLYPVIVSTVLPVVRPDAFAVRLPSTVGFAAMLLFILAFCHRRMPAIYAFIAALMPAIICGFYATEGRCYGLVLGCAAGALAFWQAATESGKRTLPLVLLAICLMLATALHYYSIFLLIPLVLAELLRWRRRGKPDLVVLSAILPALVVLGVHYPLIAVGRKYLLHFWAPGIASWRQIPDFYLQFALLPIGVVLAGLIARALRPASHVEKVAQPLVLPAQEWVAVVVLAFMPILVVAIAQYTTHVFLARYVVWAAIGLAILSASVLYRSTAKQPLLGVAVFAVLLAMFAVGQWRALCEQPTLRQGEAIRRELQFVPKGPQPIVIGYNHAFVELSYYAEPRLRQRLEYPLSRSLELRYRGTDLDYFLLSGLGARTNLHIVNLDSFLQTNPRFMLATTTKDYLPQYLASAGYKLMPIDAKNAPGLYEVEHGQ